MVDYYLFRILKNAPDSPIALEITYFITLVIMILSAVGFLYDVTVKDILFAGIGGYTAQHIGYSIQKIICSTLSIEKNKYMFEDGLTISI